MTGDGASDSVVFNEYEQPFASFMMILYAPAVNEPNDDPD